MTNQICVHCFVSGTVQGVWFRANTQAKAKELGITGWVRNLEDGRVEVIACGDREQINALHEWLKQGPPKANVTHLTCEVVDWQEYSQFDVV